MSVDDIDHLNKQIATLKIDAHIQTVTNEFLVKQCATLTNALKHLYAKGGQPLPGYFKNCMANNNALQQKLALVKPH